MGQFLDWQIGLLLFEGSLLLFHGKLEEFDVDGGPNLGCPGVELGLVKFGLGHADILLQGFPGQSLLGFALSDVSLGLLDLSVDIVDVILHGLRVDLSYHLALLHHRARFRDMNQDQSPS